MHAVILAGGQGTRLRPYTTILPKPLMPIGDLPILEIVLRQLKRHGVTRVTMAVSYLAGLIEAYRAVTLHGRWPEWSTLGTAGLVSVAIFVAGYTYFRRTEWQFADMI